MHQPDPRPARHNAQPIAGRSGAPRLRVNRPGREMPDRSLLLMRERLRLRHPAGFCRPKNAPDPLRRSRMSRSEAGEPAERANNVVMSYYCEVPSPAGPPGETPAIGAQGAPSPRVSRSTPPEATSRRREFESPKAHEPNDRGIKPRVRRHSLRSWRAPRGRKSPTRPRTYTPANRRGPPSSTSLD